MISKKKKVKAKPSESATMASLDSFESWLAKQPVKSVKAKSGFISTQEIEATQ